jgi:hypothetical protein
VTGSGTARHRVCCRADTANDTSEGINSLRNLASVALMVLSGMLTPAAAQRAEQNIPLVVDGKMPLYPILARAARIQGVVKIKVTTDGKKVTSVDAESGPPMLVKFAKENILTWEFTAHKPTVRICDRGASAMRLQQWCLGC